MTRYMITEKSEHIIKRAIGWLQMWKYALECKDEEAVEGFGAMADEQLEKLNKPVKLTVPRYMELIEQSGRK